MRLYYNKVIDSKRGELILMPYAKPVSCCENCSLAKTCKDLWVANLLGYLIVKCDIKKWLNNAYQANR